MAPSTASKGSSTIRRRGTVTGFAVVVGAFAFLTGVGLVFNAFSVDEPRKPAHELFLINASLGAGAIYLALGGFLVVQAASALGGTASSPVRFKWPFALLAFFPLLVWAGQYQADNPERLPWLFPFVNIAMVSIPSLTAAAGVAARYSRAHPLAWPISWREWTSGIVYGAIGATTIAALINTLYLFAGGYLLVQAVAGGGPLDGFGDSLRSLPQGWGIAFDLSVLSVEAPITEEFWKGMLVAFFFFRRGGLARCFVWGVLAGAGFNLLETFQNSLSAVHPSALADQTIGSEWWFFAMARAGTAAMHSLATGLAAIGFYGLFRKKPRYLLGYPAGVALHGSWNFLVYVIWGDALLSQQGPDTRALDILGGVGLAAVFLASAVALWVLSGSLRDEAPAPIYRLLGMRPGGPAPPSADSALLAGASAAPLPALSVTS
ncbi:MAG: PrsW family glutamic-type intramembrane protease [Dehalococcoidia bacterium]